MKYKVTGYMVIPFEKVIEGVTTEENAFEIAHDMMRTTNCRKLEINYYTTTGETLFINAVYGIEVQWLSAYKITN